jgi:hypothetical protein
MVFLISDFRRVLKLVCFLLGISPASIQPLKMDLTEGSETSAKLNLTPGKYPKENIQVLYGSYVENMLLDIFAIDRSRSSCHVAVAIGELAFLLLPDIPCSCLSREIVSWFSKVLPYWIW